MAQNNDLSNLNGLFKNVYGSLHNLIPDNVKLMNMVPFAKAQEQLGYKFVEAVVLGLEHGVSYGLSSDGAFTLDASVAGATKDAQVDACQFVLRTSIAYNVLARALKDGPQAFESGTKHIVANMLRSLSKRIEMSLMYGKVGIGVIDFGAGKTSAGSTTTIYITPATWAPGIWAGAENMNVVFHDETAPGMLDSGNSRVISAVDMDNYKLTISAALNLTGLGSNTISLYPKSAIDASANKKECDGLHSIMSSTGTLFNIATGSFSLWKPNVYSAGSAQLSFGKIQKAISRGVEKGLDGDVTVLVNPRTWTDLLSDQAALRRYDSGYKKDQFENGANYIKFYGQNGMIEITPDVYVKEGSAYVLSDPKNSWKRIGSTDITFKRPGSGDQFVKELENAAGVELRAMSEQSLYTNAPAHSILISNIVNQS